MPSLQNSNNYILQIQFEIWNLITVQLQFD